MTVTQSLLKRMMVSAINAREVESNRISRLLHDEVGQVLSAVGLQLDVLKLDYQRQLPEIIERVHEIQKMLDQAVSQVRALSYDLNPSIVERAGLQLALERLVGRFRPSGPTIRFLYDPSLRPPLPVGNAWYKIAELALDNAVRHADAKQIELRAGLKGDRMALEIRDDGQGFPFSGLAALNAETSGLGLSLMEHYATQAEVDLEIVSAPGEGASVKSTYPGSTGSVKEKQSKAQTRGRNTAGRVDARK